MSRSSITMVNQTQITIDLCKASTDVTPLYPKSSIDIPMTARSWLHGHSDKGGFVICRYDTNFSTKTWGNFTLTLQKNEDNFTFHVTEKT